MSLLSVPIFSFLLVFVARATDVSMGTVRVMMITKGYKLVAAVIGFFEVLIWLAAMGTVLNNLDRIENILGYALGFAVGNYLGMILEEKIAMGYLSIRLVTRRDACALIEKLRLSGFAFIQTKAIGNSGEVSVIYCTIKRTNFHKWLEIVKKFNPGAFYTISDLKKINSDVFSIERPALNVPSIRV